GSGALQLDSGVWSGAEGGQHPDILDFKNTGKQQNEQEQKASPCQPAGKKRTRLTARPKRP
ncbi:hypothetical protein, partial [Salmonella enterica]|uniref:hypothetical protein n=1 Tax=Salmonella enterica TaxID=28901 RepID=UPI001C62700D